MAYQNNNNGYDVEPTLIANEFIASEGMNRVIDFRDKLFVAPVEAYARIHPAKGDQDLNIYPSLIQVWLTNSGNGKKISVKCNISPMLPYEWLEVCKQSFGYTVIPMYRKERMNNGKEVMMENSVGSLVKSIKACSRIGRAFLYLIEDRIDSLYSRIDNNTASDSPEEYQMQIGALEKSSKALRSKDLHQQYALRFKRKFDYSFTETKVNTYKETNGYVPVAVLTVEHFSILNKKGGEESRYPWNINIKNFEAKKKVKSRGLTAYDPKTIRNEKMAYIRLSDEAMYQLMMRVTKFIEIWEMANVVPVVREGVQRQRNRHYEDHSQWNANNGGSQVQSSQPMQDNHGYQMQGQQQRAPQYDKASGQRSSDPRQHTAAPPQNRSSQRNGVPASQHTRPQYQNGGQQSPQQREQDCAPHQERAHRPIENTVRSNDRRDDRYQDNTQQNTPVQTRFDAPGFDPGIDQYSYRH